MNTFDNDDNIETSLFDNNKCKTCVNVIGCYLNKNTDKQVCLDTEQSLFKNATILDYRNITANLILISTTQQKIISEVKKSRDELDEKIADIMTGRDLT